MKILSSVPDLNVGDDIEERLIADDSFCEYMCGVRKMHDPDG